MASSENPTTSKEKKFWTNDELYQIIMAYKKHPALWNVHHEYFFHSEVTTHAVQQIAKQFGVSEKAMRLTLIKILQTFMKQREVYNFFKFLGVKNYFRSVWPFYDVMYSIFKRKDKITESIQQAHEVSQSPTDDRYDRFGRRVAEVMRNLPTNAIQTKTKRLISKVLDYAESNTYDIEHVI